MGEYVRHMGSEVKIGTCENLYYVSYPKYIAALQNGYLTEVGNNCAPYDYATPDSGFRFRFPFPDEDKLSFGDIGKHDHRRGVTITLDSSIIEPPNTHKKNNSLFTIEIVQQKLVYRQGDKKLCLALVCNNPSSGKYFRIEDDDTINKMLSQIIKHHVLQEPNEETKSFYRSIAHRILKGFRLNSPNMEVKREIKTQPYLRPAVNNIKRRLR